MASHIQLLDDISKQLVEEKDTKKLLSIVLEGAMKLTHADGGSVYSLSDHDTLIFEVVRTHSLQLSQYGDSVEFPEVPLRLDDGTDNIHMVVAYAVIENRVINVADAYHAKGFDFSGTRLFDKKTGYRTQSVLTVPMYDHQGHIIGVLQLINAIEVETGEICQFTEKDQHLVGLLTSQAAFTLASKLLFDKQQKLFAQIKSDGL